MPDPNRNSTRTVRLSAFGFLAVLTIARLIFSATFPLAADEAYYWQWSRHLAFG